MEPFHRPGEPDPRSILIVLPTWVGDFVMATPALRAIRHRFPEAHIVFLMEANLHDLVRGGDWMNETVSWPSRERRSVLHREYRDFVWELRRRRFDWAVLLPNSFRSALLARLAGAKRRIGYHRDGRGLLLTDCIPVKNRRCRGGQPPALASDLTNSVAELNGPRIWPGPHAAVRMGNSLPAALGPFRPMPMVEYYADLAQAIGCERPGDTLELFVTPDCESSVKRRLLECGIQPRAAGLSPRDRDSAEDRATGLERPLVVISPGAKFGASKCWPPDRFAAVADRLVESDAASVVITCGPGEERIAQDIAAAMRKIGMVWDQPLLSLGELKSLIRRCDLLICNDAGPRHFAKAFNVPLVTIFGPTHPEWTATSYPDERIVRMDIDCGPCQQKLCPLGHHRCMTEIDADLVYAAAVELLQGRRGAAHPIREHVHG